MILCALAFLALLQTQSETYAARAVVTDAKGVALRDLEAGDVSLSEGGVTRQLSRFERDERPMRLALIIDSSAPMTTAYRSHLIPAAKAFLDALPSSTRVVVWTTGDRPTKVIDDLDLSEDGATKNVVSKLARAISTGGNTLLDALPEAAEELAKSEGERKVLVFLSATGPGFASRDKRSVVDDVMKRNVEVTGVLVSESGDGSGGGDVPAVDYEFVASDLTQKTGGRLERSLSVMGASLGMSKVAADLRSTYRLVFQTPAGGKRARLALQVARPGAKARLSTPQKEAR